MTRALVVLCLVSLTAGCECGGEEPGPAPPPEPPPPPAPIAAGRRIADPGAFALVPIPDGALLVWGAPYASGGGVRTLRLGPLGAALDEERAVADRGAAAGGAAEDHVSQAVEVEAYAVGQDVGVAWVLDYGHHLETQAAFSVDGGQRWSATEELGHSVRLPEGRRGRLAMTGNDEALVLYHRIEEADCVASEGRCARFTRRGLGEGASRVGRGTEPLEVRYPCEPLVAGAAWAEGSWYHGVCHEDGGRVTTTVYAIRPELAYAAPTPIEGCSPVGMTPLGPAGVAVVTRCGEARHAVRLDEMGRVVQRFAPVERVVSCEDGRPTLELRQGSEQRKLRLGEALDHLEPMLPEDVAPEGSRAVWTGEALLLASPMGRELVLRRYQCEGDRFDRTDMP